LNVDVSNFLDNKSRLRLCLGGFHCSSIFMKKGKKERAMPNLNKVQLIGRLGKDPETRTIPSGKKVCTFSLAVNQHWRSPDGELKESVEWVNLEAWGRIGEVCQQYLSKGNLIYAEGRLHTDRYEKDGENRYFTKVIIQNMQNLEKRSGEDVEEAEYTKEPEF
jgi:single-strand DNA-binding protein